MDWKALINREFITIAGLLILLIFILSNNKMDRIHKVVFYISIAVAVLEAFLFEFELWPATWSEPSFLRIILSYFGYLCRPLLVYFLILVSNRSIQSAKDKLLLLVPEIVLSIVLFFAFIPTTSKIVFYYDEVNEFHRGVLGWAPHIILFGYFFIYLIMGVKQSKKGKTQQKIISWALPLFAVLALLVDTFFKGGYTRIAIFVCTFFAYVQYQNTTLFSMVDDVPGALVHFKIFKGQCKLVSFNKTLSNMIGVKPDIYESLASQDLLVFLPSEYRHFGDNAIKDIIKGQDEVRFDFKYNLEDEQKWFNVQWKVSNRSQDEINVYGVMFDVTQERMLEEENLIREKELSISMSQMGKMICVYDVSTRTLSIPEKYAKKHGFVKKKIRIPDDVVANHSISKDSIKKYEDFYRTIDRGTASGTDHSMFILPNGDYCWEKCEFVTIFDKEGKPQRAILAIEDISKTIAEQNLLDRYKSTIDSLIGEAKFCLQYDLTNDYVLAYEGGFLRIPDNFKELRLDEIVNDHLEHNIKDGDKSFYKDFMNSKKLIESYNKGQTHHFIEREAKMFDGTERWFRLSAYLDNVDNDTIIATFLWEDIDDDYRRHSEVYNRANYDSLTGLLSRSATMEKIEDYMNNESPEGTHALVMMDMDNLKGVNDKLGHQFGDIALQRFANEIKSCFREDDIIGRIGGDEFFAFIKNITAESVSKKVAALLAALDITYSDKGNQVQTSASAGITLYHGDKQKKTLSELYSEADVALYKAKAKGKNNYSFFNSLDILSDRSGAIKVLKSNHTLSYNLHELFNRMSVGVAIYHGTNIDDIEIAFCNESFIKLLGIKNDEWTKKAGSACNFGIHPDDFLLVKNTMQCALQHNNNKVIVGRMRKSDKEYRWLKGYTNFYLFEDGSFDIYINYIDANSQIEQHDLMDNFNNSIRKALQKATPKEGLDVVLKTLGEQLKAERTFIFERDSNGQSVNTYEWVGKGVKPLIGDSVYSKELSEPWYKTIKQRGLIVGNDLGEIKELSIDIYNNFKERNIQSYVIAPIHDQKNNVIGFYGVDNPKIDITIISDLLLTLSYFIQSFLRKL